MACSDFFAFDFGAPVVSQWTPAGLNETNSKVFGFASQSIVKDDIPSFFLASRQLTRCARINSKVLVVPALLSSLSSRMISSISALGVEFEHIFCAFQIAGFPLCDEDPLM